MKYYKALRDINLPSPNYDIIVKDGLYTERELNKVYNVFINQFTEDFFELVEIKKTKTYWFFGVRFSD